MEKKKYTPEENRLRFKVGELLLDEYLALPVEERLCGDGGLDDDDEFAPPPSDYFEPE